MSYRVDFVEKKHMKHIMKNQIMSCSLMENFSLFDFVLLYKSSIYQKILDLNLDLLIFDSFSSTKRATVNVFTQHNSLLTYSQVRTLWKTGVKQGNKLCDFQPPFLEIWKTDWPQHRSTQTVPWQQWDTVRTARRRRSKKWPVPHSDSYWPRAMWGQRT